MGGNVIDDTWPLLAVDERAWPMEPWGSDCCRCHGDTEPEDNMLCMPIHVFVFCILLSALVSGTVVASQQIWDGLNRRLNQLLRRSAYVHNPHYKHSHVADTIGTESEDTLVEAAEAMDRAAATSLEHAEIVPPRYVRAFCGNEKHALERWKATLQWRKDNDIDSILNEPQPFFHDIRRYFPSNMSGRSRGGHIVVYQKLGDVDMRTLSRELGVTVPILLRHWIFVSEYMYRVLQPTDSAQQVTVVDMAGTRIQSLAGKIQEYTKAAAQLARLHYVERCHKTFVVHAPAWFGLAFRVVSPFLSARTRQKIRILGSDLSALQDEIDPQFLPVEYGGKSSVPVCDSPEERHLRRLVDAINANANKANTHGNNDDVGTTSGKSKHTPSRVHRGKTSPSRSGKSTKVQDAKRNRSGKGVVDAPTTPSTSRKGRRTPLSNRSRASTDEGTPARRPFLDQNAANGIAGDGAAAGPPTLAPRRATWAEGGAGEKHLDEARAEVEAAFEAWRASSSDGTALVGQGGGGGTGPRLDRTCRKGEEVGAAGHGAGSVRAYGEGRVAVSSRPDGRSSDAERRAYDGAYGDTRGVEDNLPIEDRLQAVMKDLGVPLEACVGTGDRRPARDSREQQLSMAGEGGGTGGLRSARTTELTAGEAINNRMGEEGPPKSALGSSRLGSDTARGQLLASSGDGNNGEANITDDTSGCRPTCSAQTDARPVTLVAGSSGNDANAN